MLSSTATTGAPRSPTAASATPKNDANTTTCRMSPLAMASTTDVGTMCSRMSHPVCCCRAIAARAAVSVPAGRVTPAPGWNTFTSTRPMTSATVVASSNQMIALRPMRPIARRSPVPAMPTTSVENSSGAMIILIIRRNRSASGLISTPNDGQSQPMTTPMARPMKICAVRPGSRLGAAPPAARTATTSPSGPPRRAPRPST